MWPSHNFNKCTDYGFTQRYGVRIAGEQASFSYQPGHPTPVHLPVFNKIALPALEIMPNQARNQNAPSWVLRLHVPKTNLSIIGCLEDSRSQNRRVSQLQALCADSFLTDKLNPLWEKELSYRFPKPNSKDVPGAGLRGSQRKWNLGGRAGKVPENRKWASALQSVSKRGSFHPDWLGCIQLPFWWGSNVGFLSEAAGEDRHAKMKTWPEPLFSFPSPKSSRNALNKK